MSLSSVVLGTCAASGGSVMKQQCSRWRTQWNSVDVLAAKVLPDWQHYRGSDRVTSEI